MNHSEVSAKTQAGWSIAEDELLFNEVNAARECGRSLRSVFEVVAAKTRRMPNSVRNYYYLRLRDDDMAEKCLRRSAAFVAFTQSEVRELVKTVLAEQAKGVSVRACTLRLSGNDNKLMLRLQNKYRAVLRGNPELIGELVTELQLEGVQALDPYESQLRRRSGRPQKQSTRSLVALISSTVNELSMVEEVDLQSLLSGLEALARRANTNSVGSLSSNALCSELRETIKSQENELREQRTRFSILMRLFKRLMNVNREFLNKSNTGKITSLDDYISELSGNVLEAEHIMS